MELSDLIKNDDGSYTFPFDTKTSVHSSEPARVFAEKFGCHISTIHYIRNGKLWGWLTGGGMSAV